MVNACFRSHDWKLTVRITNEHKNGFILLDHVLFKINWISIECNAPCVGFPIGSVVKNLSAMQEMQEMWAWCLGWEDPLEEGIATHSSVLAWRIPWTEEAGELQVTESRYYWNDWAHTYVSGLRYMRAIFFPSYSRDCCQDFCRNNIIYPLETQWFG